MHACERPALGMTMKDDHDASRWKYSNTTDELSPLSKSLLSPAAFSSAFSIKPSAPLKNGTDVSRESLASLLDLRQRSSLPAFFKDRKDAGKLQFSESSIQFFNARIVD